MTDASTLALTRLASQVSLRKELLLDKDGISDDVETSILDDTTHREVLKASWALSLVGNVDLPAWPIAIPTPYKYYFSLYNPSYWNILFAYASSITDYSSCEIGSDINYGIPYKMAGGLIDSTSTVSRTVNVNVRVAAWLQVIFYQASTPDLITWTITVDGTPYTGTIDSTKVGDPDHIVRMPLATPWDLPKSVVISWTGGSTALSVGATTFYVYPVGPATPPSGWDINKLGMRTGSNSLTDNGSCANQDVCYALEHWFRFYRNSSNQFLKDLRTPSSSLQNTRSVGPLHHANTDQFGKFNPAFLAKEASNTSLSHFNGFRGFPTVVAGVHKLAKVFTPQDQTYSFSTNTGVELVCRSLKKVILLFYYDPVGGAVLYHTLKLSTFPGGTTIYSTTYTQSTASWVLQTLPLAPYQPAGGTGFGSVQVDIIATYSGGSTVNITGYACLVEEPCPLPWAIETSDGHAIPGATHPSARTDPLPSTLLYGSTPTDFYYTDIPTSTKIWHGSFTGTTPGYYIMQSFTSGGVKNAEVNIVADGPIVYNDSSACVLVNSLSAPYFIGQDIGWGAYGRPDASYTTSVNRITLTPLTVSPFALSLGDTNVGISYTAMGTPTHPTSHSWNYLFNSFTAPADGTYSFVLTSASARAPLLNKIQLWVSSTDPYCMDTTLPVQTESILLGLINSPSAPTATLPLGTSGQSQKNILLTNGTVATAYNYNSVGATLDWRISSPPVGTVGGTNPQYILLPNRTWAIRGSAACPLINYKRTMASGETIYLRVSQTGQYRRRYGHPLFVVPTALPVSVITWSVTKL